MDYAEYEKLVKNDISDTLEKLKNLYTTAFELIDDYNAYVPSKHIESLTGIRYYENVYSSLYYLIAVIIGFVLSCIIALAIEIMRRYAYFSKNGKNDGETLEPSSVIPDISTDDITD